MTLNLQHLAKLSNITFTTTENTLFERQIPETIDYVKNLSEIDTTHISKYERVCPNKNITFKDGEELPSKLAPADYKVKRIM